MTAYTIGNRALVLIGEPSKRTVRAYERTSHQFTATAGGLRDETGQIWRVTEEALISPDDTRLPRVAGHISYWFAWNNYLGDAASVYDG